MKTYILLHSHEYGTTPYVFQTRRKESALDLPSVALQLGANFEEDKGENLELVEMPNLSNVPVV